MRASGINKGLRILNVEPKGYSEEARQDLMTLGELVEKEMTRANLLERHNGKPVAALTGRRSMRVCG